MFADLAVPLLRERFSLAGEPPVLRGTVFMTPESALEEALRGARREGVGWGTRVEEDRIAFSLRGGSDDDREACFNGVLAALGTVRVCRGETRPANVVLDALAAAGLVLATGESCTGGLIGRYLTDVPGSSHWYWGGVVSYANAAKVRMLGVPAAVLERYGAVSAETVAAMARGTLAVSGAGLALAVSGIAGPEGGTPQEARGHGLARHGPALARAPRASRAGSRVAGMPSGARPRSPDCSPRPPRRPTGPFLTATWLGNIFNTSFRLRPHGRPSDPHNPGTRNSKGSQLPGSIGCRRQTRMTVPRIRPMGSS